VNARIGAPLALLVLIFSVSPAEPRSGDSILRAEFSCARELRPGIGKESVLGPDELARRLGTEAAWVYMGMIYGFAVDYVPYDAARRVHESFEALPSWDVKAPRPSLSLAEGRFEGTVLKMYAEYRMSPAEASRYAAWREGGATPFQAEGRAAESAGPDARFTAMEQAVKAAVKAYASALEPNKPRRVRALVAFERPPSISLDAGLYVARARARIKIVEIVPYPGI
jgi:hypothetical protein